MFKRFSIYIDIVTEPKHYAAILKIIESFTNICEPITNISQTFEKPNFIYNLLIIDHDKINFEAGNLTTISEAYSTAIILNVPDTEQSYECLLDANIRLMLRRGFYERELEAILKEFMQMEILKFENTLLDSLFNSAQNSIVITDKKGNIQFANPYFEKLTEYKNEELIAQSPRVLKAGQHSEQFYQELWETIASGKEWEGIFINRSKNDHIFYEEATITPIKNSHGAIERYLKIGKNITREKMLLAELSKEVKVAKNVLKALLPEKSNDGFIDFDYHILDYNEIGGDFITYKEIGDRVVMALIDVMGHGVSAALIALTVARMVDDHATYLSLEETVSMINHTLLNINQDNEDNAKFVTGIFIEVDKKCGLVKVINAGHPDAIIVYNENSPHKMGTIPSNNLLLGVFDQSQPHAEVFLTSEVKRLILYTDGIYENRGYMLDAALNVLTDDYSKLLACTAESMESLLGPSQDTKDDSTVVIVTLM